VNRNSVRAVWTADGAAKSSGLDRVVILVIDVSATLTTIALYDSSLQWFEART